MTTAPKLNDKQREALTKAQPMWKIVLTQFLEHRMAVAGSLVIAIFVSIALFAPLITKITGLHPDYQNVFARYEKMGSVVDISTINREMRIDALLEEQDLSALKEVVLSANLLDFEVHPDDVFYELVSAYPPAELSKKLAQLPATQGLSELQKVVKSFRTFHLLGTDELGRDVFIRLVYGTRISITVGVLVAFAAALIGLLIGSLAGYYGGKLDAVLMRVTDALLSLPLLVVLIVVSAIDLTKVVEGTPLSFMIGSENESIFKMVMILCLFSWMQVARLVRGSILSLKEQEFILAAKTLGARDHLIIGTHVVPNVIAPLLVAVTLGVGNSILFEAALSFLGLGIQPPTPSWGNMLNNAQEMIQHSPMLAILPGVLILLTVISFNYVGDGLQDAIDPKAIKR